MDVSQKIPNFEHVVRWKKKHVMKKPSYSKLNGLNSPKISNPMVVNTLPSLK